LYNSPHLGEVVIVEQREDGGVHFFLGQITRGAEHAKGEDLALGDLGDGSRELLQRRVALGVDDDGGGGRRVVRCEGGRDEDGRRPGDGRGGEEIVCVSAEVEVRVAGGTGERGVGRGEGERGREGEARGPGPGWVGGGKI
jgi:hypothetical protein